MHVLLADILVREFRHWTQPQLPCRQRRQVSHSNTGLTHAHDALLLWLKYAVAELCLVSSMPSDYGREVCMGMALAVLGLCACGEVVCRAEAALRRWEQQWEQQQKKPQQTSLMLQGWGM